MAGLQVYHTHGGLGEVLLIVLILLTLAGILFGIRKKDYTIIGFSLFGFVPLTLFFTFYYLESETLYYSFAASALISFVGILCGFFAFSAWIDTKRSLLKEGVSRLQIEEKKNKDQESSAFEENKEIVESHDSCGETVVGLSNLYRH